MADFYLKSGAGAIVLANRAWSLGDKMVPTLADASANVAVARRWVWECTTAATSTGTPTWSASVTQDATTVTQNGVVWTARKPGFSSGTTANWAYAAIYMHYVASALAAGDRLFVSNNHAETQGSVSSVNVFAGTLASPNLIICVDDSAAPPTALATTATVTTTANNSITLAGTFYQYGISYSGGTGASGGNSTLCNTSGPVKQVYQNCQFKMGSTAGNVFFLALTNSASPAELTWIDCDMRMNATTQRFRINNVKFTWRGGTYLGGGTNPTSLFSTGTSGIGSSVVIVGVDFSNIATTTSFVVTQPAINLDFRVRDIILQSNWTAGIFSAAITNPGIRGSMIGYDGTHQNSLWVEDCSGTTKISTAVYRTSGASDGTTPLSWKMQANSDNIDPVVGFGLRSPEFAIWNDTTGAQRTATIEIIHGSAALLTDSDIFIDTDYFISGSLAGHASDAVASVLATPANQTTSTAAWTGPARANSTAYAVGDVVTVSGNVGRLFFCSTAGTSAGSEPGGMASAVDGGTVADNTVTWTCGWRQQLAVQSAVNVSSKGPIYGSVVLTLASAIVSPIYVDLGATIS